VHRSQGPHVSAKGEIAPVEHHRAMPFKPTASTTHKHKIRQPFTVGSFGLCFDHLLGITVSTATMGNAWSSSNATKGATQGV
jgi:hypothetical protein